MKTQFKPEQYSPSSEEHRKCIETQRNYHRNNAYLEKKGELDVSSEQEPYYGEGQAEETFTNMLANDPDYQKWLDNLDKTPS